MHKVTEKKDILKSRSNLLETSPRRKSKTEKKKSKRAIFKETVEDKDYIPYGFVGGRIFWNAPYTFPAEDGKPAQFRPRCINPGCIEPVGYTSTTTTGLKILRSVCNACHTRGWKQEDAPPHITIHKKTYCENIDGHLGFPCTSTIHYSGVLELDHKNGDHYHNLQDNVETLCKICHAYKSFLNGDHR